MVLPYKFKRSELWPMKKEDLVQLASQNGTDSTGSKFDIIFRLRKLISNNGAAAAEAASTVLGSLKIPLEAKASRKDENNDEETKQESRASSNDEKESNEENSSNDDIDETKQESNEETSSNDDIDETQQESNEETSSNDDVDETKQESNEETSSDDEIQEESNEETTKETYADQVEVTDAKNQQQNDDLPDDLFEAKDSRNPPAFLSNVNENCSESDENIKKRGFMHLFKTSKMFGKWVRRIMAVPLLPHHMMNEVFEELLQQTFLFHRR